MSNNVQTIPSFSFHNNSIRVQGTTDNPLFCLADVCKVLALVDPSKTVKQIKEEFGCPELNSGHLKDRLGRDQQATFITEPQLYFVMMRSRAKVAKEFRQWVVNEVLPSIRKTGAYIQSSKTEHQSYLKIFKDFCLQHNYSNEEIKMFDYLREQALKQGYAIACAKLKEQENVRQLKEDEIAIPKSTAKHIYEYLDWICKHRKEMMKTAEDMREQSRTLMYMAECYDVLRAGVKNVIFKKL